MLASQESGGVEGDTVGHGFITANGVPVISVRIRRDVVLHPCPRHGHTGIVISVNALAEVDGILELLS